MTEQLTNMVGGSDASFFSNVLVLLGWSVGSRFFSSQKHLVVYLIFFRVTDFVLVSFFLVLVGMLGDYPGGFLDFV